MLPRFEHIVLEKKGKIATLTINRPERMNAMNSQTRRELVAAMSDVAKDDAVRVLVMTGAGDRAFTAGQDLTESKGFRDEDAGPWIKEFETLYNSIIDMPKPVIAKINGYAVGAGFQIALLCDIRVASENSKVAMTEINVGIPCITGSYLIYAVAGYAPAAELTLTGEIVDAKRAYELGLVNKVVPTGELDKAVNELAENLAEKPPVSMKWQKRWLSWFKRDLAEVSKRAQEMHSAVYASGEPAEYMTRFLEKRRKAG